MEELQGKRESWNRDEKRYLKLLALILLSIILRKTVTSNLSLSLPFRDYEVLLIKVSFNVFSFLNYPLKHVSSRHKKI